MGPSTAFALTLAAHAVFFTGLGLWIILLRRRHRVGIGDGGNRELKRAIRVHGNFAEWVPMALLAILVADLRGVDPVIIGVLGAALFAGRASHAAALSRYRVAA